MTKELMVKAEKALASARLLLKAEDSDGATNRAYYAMFDAATSALLWAGIGSGQAHPKTHGGLIGSFGLQLIQAGHLPAEFGRSLNRVHELRLVADYLSEPVPLDKAGQAIEDAAKFLKAVAALIGP